jgi:RHS repeat-associated protein
MTDTRRPHVRGKIKSIVDHEGHEVDFSYYDDGNLLRLTEPGGTNADGSPLAARSWVFTYTTSSGQPSIADPINPDPGTANESTRLYSMLDPRGNKTIFSYITSGQDKWKLLTATDRAGNVTSYAYDNTNQVTTVTDPLTRATKYAYDTDGKVTSITNVLNQTITRQWSADFALTKMTEPTGVTTQFVYNDNGALTDQYDQLNNHTKLTYQSIAIDANDVSGKWSTIGATATGRTIPHINQLATKADPLGNTFQAAYDSSGDLTQVTDPLNNVTKNAFNADGTMSSTTDANNHTTTYTSYNLMGEATQVTDALGNITQFGFTDSGKLQWIQDANHSGNSGGDPHQYRTYFYFDSFHRIGSQSTPKSFSVQPGLLIWVDTQYDATDNVVAKIDPHYGLQDAPGGAGTRTIYDAVDRQTQITGPDTSGDPQGERTQFVYDAASRLLQVTLPNGVMSPNGSAFQISYTYDGLDRMISRSRTSTDASGPHTSTTVSCYNLAGDVTSVTGPNAGLTASSINCGSTTLPFTTYNQYDADHRVIGTTDPDGHTTATKYDAAGNVVQTTDANGNQMTNSYDQLNRLVQTVEPFITGSTPRTLTTRTQYDAVGNRTASISARAFDAAGGSGSYTRFVTSYRYNALNRLVRTDLPVDPNSADSRYYTQYYAHQAYDAIGNLVWTALPDTNSDPNQVPASKKTVMTYWDRAWIRTSKDPANPKMHFDYAPQGWQSTRIPETTSGQLDYSLEMLWSYLPDGQLQQLTDQGGLGTAYTYDAENNMVSAFKIGGVTSGDQSPLSVQLTYDQFDRAAKVREKRQQDSNYTATTYGYNLDGSTLSRTDNQIETAAGSVVTAGRQWHFDYDGADWLVDQCSTTTAVSSCAASTSSNDLRSVNSFVPTGWEQQREIDQGNGTGGWTPKQFTNWDYFANGSLHDVIVQNGGHATLESNAVSYIDGNNIYNDGNRVQDVLTLKGPDGTAPCSSTACTSTYQYDPRDRVIHEDNGHGGVTDYTLDGAGNILTENQTGNTTSSRTSQYLGNQLQQVTTTAGNQAASTQKDFYDPLGNLQCVTTSGGTRTDCNVATGGTPTANLLSFNTYDYLNRLIGYHAYTSGTGTTPTNAATYSYDTLNRMASETETHGSTPSRTTSLSYIGMTGNVAQEQQTSGGALQTTKDYSYDIVGHRLAMTVTPSGSAATTYSYGYNVHGSVSLLVDPTGNAKAAYGYRPYGDPDTALTKGDTDPTNPFNPYRYSAQRLDSASGSLDAGARRFDPGTAHYLQADSFNGSLSDQGLASDPLNQNRYALGGGNPLSERETDGHLVAADGGGGSFDYPNPDPPPPAPPPSRAKPCNGFLCGAKGFGMGLLDTAGDIAGGLKNAGGAAIHAVTHPTELPGDAAAIASIAGTSAVTFINDPGGTTRKALANGFQAAAGAVDSLTTAFTAGDDFTRWRAYSHFTSSVVATGLSGPAAVKAVSLAGDVFKGVRLAGAAEKGASVVQDVAKSCAVNSFTGDTLVLMADGSKKAIKDIRVGDLIEAGDAQQGVEVPERVDHVIVGRGLKHLIALTVAGETIRATYNHPFWVIDDQRFEWANQLTAHEHLWMDGGRTAAVESARSFDQVTTVYNLSITSVHTYFVGRNAVLVHNVCGPDLDALSASGQREISPQGITKAGASIEQHQAELGINVTGGTAAKNALGQFLLDDILTNPGTIHLPVTSGRFAGGLYFISPTGVGAAFDANRVFQYFGIFSR